MSINKGIDEHSLLFPDFVGDFVIFKSCKHLLRAVTLYAVVVRQIFLGKSAEVIR